MTDTITEHADTSLKEGEALVELEDVGKRYGAIRALKGIDLTVRAGEVTCVLGDNGAGKSTLIKIISGLHPHNEGTLKVDGAPVIILNGFHPRQLSFFIADDTVCAFLHASSPTDWDTLRSDLIGSTDPSKADGGSLRGRLYADPAGFGLESVSYNFNGVHMSAGPLEGLAELDRFFGAGAPATGWRPSTAWRSRGSRTSGASSRPARRRASSSSRRSTSTSTPSRRCGPAPVASSSRTHR